MTFEIYCKYNQFVITNFVCHFFYQNKISNFSVLFFARVCNCKRPPESSSNCQNLLYVVRDNRCSCSLQIILFSLKGMKTLDLFKLIKLE